MSPSEPIATRKLVIDTRTPGTEIFILDANGRLKKRGIRVLEADLPLALYKIRFRVGDRVTDTLIELAPGQNPSTPRYRRCQSSHPRRRSRSPAHHPTRQQNLPRALSKARESFADWAARCLYS
jgi:hypothetical protein